MGEIFVIFVCPHDLSVAKEDKSDGTSRRAHIDRLPQPVEHKHLPVQSGAHNLGWTVSCRL